MLYQSPDTLIPISDLNAFTHPRFFFSNDCKCSRFNSEYLWLEIYKTPTDSHIPYQRANPSIVPLDFDAGYSVVITGKQGDFFRIRFNEKVDTVNSQCKDCYYYVKKGTLGTWVFNGFDSTGEYKSIPLYNDTSSNSKVITILKPEDSIVIILDIRDNWMFVETISKKKKKRGLLDPKMQYGDPLGLMN
jgi:hypothetical protein